MNNEPWKFDASFCQMQTLGPPQYKIWNNSILLTLYQRDIPLIFWGLYWTMNLHQFCKILVHQHEKHFYWIHTDEKERHTFVASRICKILVHHHQQTNISFELNLFQTQQQMYKDKDIIVEFIPNPAFLLRGRFIITNNKVFSVLIEWIRTSFSCSWQVFVSFICPKK